MKINAKKLLPLILAPLCLAACTPGVPKVPEEEWQVEITNKEAIQREWVEGGESRDLLLNLDPVMSIEDALEKGKLTVTTTSKKVEINGLTIKPTTGTGTITVKVNYGGGTDNVKFTISEDLSGLKTNDDFQKASLTYTSKGVTKPLNINTLYGNTGDPHLDGLGEVHALVVPFGFTDSNLQERQSQATIDRIRTVFFGTKEEMDRVGGWRSLADYYGTSSYGHTTFAGEVLPTWCVYSGTSSSFESNNNGGTGMAAAKYAANWYKTEYNKEGHGALGEDAHPFKWFDNNDDGFLDMVWVVYSHPTGEGGGNWWAYVTYDPSATANKTTPNVKTIGWASIDWMNAGFNGYDAHTFIHETGHGYGLPDYYDYNGKQSPLGSVDMMDHNVGDHSMFSKFQLGWTAPLVVDDEAVITLRPGTTTGDCFIIPAPGYNGTAFDEYMMFELMAPVGLAEQDYINGYENVSGYSNPGIRIIHADNRAYANTDGGKRPQTSDFSIAKDIRVDNSYGGRDYMTKVVGDFWTHSKEEKGKTTTFKKYFTQASIMESNCNAASNWTMKSTYNASNSSLFQEGHTFYLDDSENGWGQLFMPSMSNLWNKAKTILTWTGSSFENYAQTVEIDETCTFDYTVKVKSIVPDEEFGYIATVIVKKNASTAA